MKTKLKVILPAVIALFALSAGYCDRDEDRYYVDRDQCEKEETQSIDDQGYDQGHSASEQHMLGAYNTPARIDVKGSWDFMVRASFIYWQALTHDTYFGQYSNFNYGVAANIPVPQHRHFADFDYDYHPGFKVGLGINSSHDNWNCYFDYTRFYMDEKGKARTTDNGVTLMTSWDSVQIQDIANEIPYAKWKLMMNVVDWSLGRPYYVGTYLTFRSFIGTKAYWNYERFYTNTPDLERSHYVNKNNSWGLGTRGGIETNWIFGAGFRLFGNAAFSLNYQHYRIRHYAFSADNIAAPALNGEPWVNYKDSRDAVVPVAEMALGLGWGTYFDDCSWHVDLSASYEFQVWWDQNNLMAYSATDNYTLGAGFVSTGSPYNPTKLMLHGLTVQLKLDF